MPGSIFIDKAKKPTDKEVSKALGEAEALWVEFEEHLREEYATISEEWKFYKSWHFKLARKARTVCYLFPMENYFTVALVFGEKAVAVARESKLPKKIMDNIESARVYAEGRGFYVDVKKPADLKHVIALTAIKMKTK